MTPNVQLDVDYLRTLGVTFLPSFHAGAVGVIARYDLPRLFYPSDFGMDRLDGIIEKLNSNLRTTYHGCGYYGSCPPGESDSGDDIVYVLFADNEFYDDYRNGNGGSFSAQG
ncbi:hypothetical protein CX658_30945 [Pseudomonas amygdali pv. lachrymans]|nr:hypothetical protein CX658_30945 [Pseudomonas amygdali pv. lachrymans]